MIELTTGLPGNAKTLFTIDMVIKRAEKENRAVYYSGLKEFKTDDPRLKGTTWIEFDPMTWHETVPSGAIIFIDECQKIFRNRTLGTIPGKHVTELEEHRHKGLDFYLITQDPGLIDPAVRKLTQTHRHMVRIHGGEASTVHLWRTGVKDNCGKNRSDSEKSRWPFAKDLYGIYKSADEHTMRKQIPPRVIFLYCIPVVIAILIGVAYYYLSSVVPDREESSKKPVASNPLVQTVQAERDQRGLADGEPFSSVDEVAEWVRMNTPRVEGLPETAPKYDGLTQPKRVPVPAMCIQIGSVRDSKPVKCKCFTQQVTPMEVEFNTCISIAQNGRFMDFDPDPGRKRDESAVRLADASQAERSAQVLSARLPDVPLGPNYEDSRVSAFAEAPSQLHGARPAPNLNDGPPRDRTTRTEVAP